jgi:hypothetical protein
MANRPTDLSAHSHFYFRDLTGHDLLSSDTPDELHNCVIRGISDDCFQRVRYVERRFVIKQMHMHPII